MRALLTATGAVLLLVALAVFPARFVPVSGHFMAVVTSGWPVFMACALPAAIALTLARRWLLAGIATALTVALVATYLPLFVPESPGDRDDEVAVRVLTANLSRGGADADSLVELVGVSADVVAVQELTPLMWRRLRAAGIDGQMSYRSTFPAPLSAGIGLWSRYAIDDAEVSTSLSMPALSASLTVPGTRSAVAILVVHVSNPVTRALDVWRSDLRQLERRLTEMAEAAGGTCVIVAGDFNSTIDMRDFRRLLTDGFREAAEQAGSGVQWTFPADGSMPALAGIDHVLTRGCRARTVRRVPVPGSDHLGLLATIEVPRR